MVLNKKAGDRDEDAKSNLRDALNLVLRGKFCLLKISVLKSQPSGAQNVTVFGDTAFEEVIKLK